MSRTLLPLRHQAIIENYWLQERLETVVGEVMARAGLDMWLVIAREYNEDPVIMSLLPQPAMSARRRTILVFHRQPDGSVERFAVSRYGSPGFYETVWKPDDEGQHECLARVIRERDPQTIGINSSQTTAFGDGLSHTEHELLTAALDDKYLERIVSAGSVAIGWLETRISAELFTMRHNCALGHQIIARAFSREVITPGSTTTHDVVWWMRQTMADYGLRAWFQPTIAIQATDEPLRPFLDPRKRRQVIMPGDLLHCDMGFHYLSLATDQQQHAYVLRDGETTAPAGLRAALEAGNRLQNIHMEQMQVGKTGNEVLADTLAAARAEGIMAMVYSHPLGYHGHAAGPTIGLWDRQGGVPGMGDLVVYNNTAWSIELNIAQQIPEWDNQTVRISLEEDAALIDNKMHWLDSRLEQLHLI